MKVLLVEDEFVISMLTEDMLSELGHEVQFAAATLDQGMEHAINSFFDFAVLDINLHGLTSYPIADILTSRSIPFIFASGYANFGIDAKYSFVTKLQKPYTISRLSDALKLIGVLLPAQN